MTTLPTDLLSDHQVETIKALAVKTATELVSFDQAGLLGRRTHADSVEAMWDGTSLAAGHPGVAMLHLEMTRYALQASPDVAHEHLRKSFEFTATSPYEDFGLYTGATGLAFVLKCFVAEESRYEESLNELNAKVFRSLADLRLRHPLRVDYPIDVISGVSGQIQYLSSAKYYDPVASEVLLRTIYFIDSGLPPEGAPHLYATYPDRYWKHEEVASYPHGYINLGLAHGVSGVALGLAAACRNNLLNSGHREKLRALATWIAENAVNDNHGIWWPNYIPLDADGRIDASNRTSVLAGDRQAWCYGTPGVLVSLLAAGRALNSTGLEAFAVKSFEDFLGRLRLENIDSSSSLCHGLGGLLLICLQFARQGSACAADYVSQIVSRLLVDTSTKVDGGNPNASESPGRVIDPSLLTGDVGTVLSLLAATDWRKAHVLDLLCPI